MNKRNTLLEFSAIAIVVAFGLTACNDGAKTETAAAPAEKHAAPAAAEKPAAPAAAEKPAAPAAAGQPAAPAAEKETGKVTTTASGLKYEILKDADGPKPKATDNVTVHYKGTLTDGTVFDSSYDRGQPATFPLNRVIKGWTEGVQLMSPGSKYKFTIPPELGYGAAGAGGRIPPNATLVFEVELIKIN